MPAQDILYLNKDENILNVVAILIEIVCIYHDNSDDKTLVESPKPHQPDTLFIFKK
jgi:hypothetical protein